MLAKKAERINFSSIVNRTDYPDFFGYTNKVLPGFFPIRNKVRRKRK